LKTTPTFQPNNSTFSSGRMATRTGEQYYSPNASDCRT